MKPPNVDALVRATLRKLSAGGATVFETSGVLAELGDSLVLTSLTLDEVCCRAIGSYVAHASLYELVFSDVTFEHARAFGALCEGVASCPSLVNLVFTNCGLDDANANKLGMAVQRARGSLRTLKLRDNAMLCPSGLLEALQHADSLESLDLSNNPIDDDAASHVASAIRCGCPNLGVLLLRGTQVSDAGEREVVQAAKARPAMCAKVLVTFD